MKSTMEEFIDDVKATAKCLSLCLLWICFFLLLVGELVFAGVLIYQLFAS